MFRVNSFLGCVKLEAFALFIGQFELIIALFISLPAVLGIIAATIAAIFFNYDLKGYIALVKALFLVLDFKLSIFQM